MARLPVVLMSVLIRREIACVNINQLPELQQKLLRVVWPQHQCEVDGSSGLAFVKQDQAPPAAVPPTSEKGTVKLCSVSTDTHMAQKLYKYNDELPRGSRPSACPWG